MSQPRLKIHRNTDGSAWWNQPEHSPESIIQSQKQAAARSGWSESDIDGASAKDLRRMTVNRKEGV